MSGTESFNSRQISLRAEARGKEEEDVIVISAGRPAQEGAIWMG
ncbi:MAG: hypothetical protein QNJ44_00440 [Rhodobacter sp.]|nr:hypothetical protein [Rhodobacter sp.]